MSVALDPQTAIDPAFCAGPDATHRALAVPDRLAALAATGLLTSPPTDALDRLTRLAGRLLDVPVATVTLVDATRQFFASQLGVGEPWASRRGTPLSHSFCQYVVGSARPLVVPDARSHPVLRHNPAVPELDVVAYAGMPLVDADGNVLGSFCAIDHRPRAWSDDELATLEELARSAMAEIALRTATRTLSATSGALSELLDTTTELVCAADPDGRLTFANRAWRETLGYDRLDTLRAIDLVASEHREPYLDAARRLATGETIEDFEAVLIARDGRRVVCRGRAMADMIDDPDAPGGRRCIATRAVYRDVTAERQAEASRARLLATIEATSDLVATASPDGTLDYLNRAGRRLVGLADDADLSTVRASDLHPTDAWAHVERVAIPAAVRQGRWTGEAALRHVDGTVVPTSMVMVAHPSLDAGGAPYVSLVGRDLRDRVRHEDALRASQAAQAASERELRALFGAMHDAVFVLDRTGTYVRVIETAEELLYREAVLLEGRRMIDVLPAAQAQEFLDVIHAALDGARAVEHEYAMHLPKGTAWFHGTVSPLGEDTVLWVARDVTARRRAEENVRAVERRFRLAMDGSLDAFVAMRSVRGADGAIVDFEIIEANHRAAALVGMPREDLLGQHMCELFPLSRADDLARWRRIVETGTGEEWSTSTADPRYVAGWLEVQCIRLEDGVAMSMRDVTARKRAEREVSLLLDVTHGLTAVDGLVDAAHTVLGAMCETAGWEYGESWLVESDGGGPPVLVAGPAWHGQNDARLARFSDTRGELRFASGDGLPGRVWANRAAVWVRDLAAADAPMRRKAEARAAGLRAGVGVPLLADGEVVAVLVFFTRDAKAVDASRVELLAAVAEQAGSAVRRKLVEDALARERTFLASVLDSLSENVSVCDARGRLTLFNRATLEYHGLPADGSIPPERWSEHFDVYLPDGTTPFPTEALPHVRAQREQRDLEDVEFVIAPKGRPRRTMVANVRLLRGPDGAWTGTVCAARDMTAQKAAERALRDSEARLSLIHDNASELIFLARVERGTTGRIARHVFESANAAFLEVLGLTTQAVVERPVGEVLPRALAHAATEMLTRAAETGDAIRIEHEVTLPTGPAYLDTTLTPILDDDGRSSYVLGTARDVTARRRAEFERARLSAVIEATSDYVSIADPDGRRVYLNAAGRAVICPPSGEDAIGGEVTQFYTAAARERYLHESRPLALRDGVWTGETEIVAADGRVVPASQVLLAHRDARGRLDFFATILRDLTEQKAVEAALRDSEARFRGVLETVRAVAFTIDGTGTVTFANDALLRLTGYRRDEVVGGDWFTLFSTDPEARRALFAEMMRRDEIPPHRESEIRTRDGSTRLIAWDTTPMLDAAGHVTGIASVGQDVTERRALEARLATLSEHDELTGLLNRRGFRRMAEQELKVERRIRRQGALLYLDLDGFKPINDTYGHAVGDEALRFVADVLRATVRDADLVARLGGDEFAVLATELGDAGPSGGELMAERLRGALATHNAVAAAAGRPYEVRFSVGVATPQPGDDLDTLMARADAALYAKKRSGARGVVRAG